uniref:Uncharacterized protein n=1 Tax=Nelumbo nucifera TaxID=4432 RepID=A0A822ZKK5_NELNU|nr:TPA_asm: hypothetical protein HUJ06_003647 [Nelumbo nucifera]
MVYSPANKYVAASSQQAELKAMIEVPKNEDY